MSERINLYVSHVVPPDIILVLFIGSIVSKSSASVSPSSAFSQLIWRLDSFMLSPFISLFVYYNNAMLFSFFLYNSVPEGRSCHTLLYLSLSLPQFIFWRNSYCALSILVTFLNVLTTVIMFKRFIFVKLNDFINISETDGVGNT
jgi:hypothetical protein